MGVGGITALSTGWSCAATTLTHTENLSQKKKPLLAPHASMRTAQLKKRRSTPFLRLSWWRPLNPRFSTLWQPPCLASPSLKVLSLSSVDQGSRTSFCGQWDVTTLPEIERQAHNEGNTSVTFPTPAIRFKHPPDRPAKRTPLKSESVVCQAVAKRSADLFGTENLS